MLRSDFEKLSADEQKVHLRHNTLMREHTKRAKQDKKNHGAVYEHIARAFGYSDKAAVKKKIGAIKRSRKPKHPKAKPSVKNAKKSSAKR